MPTILIKLESTCAGGAHATLSLSVNGVPRGTWNRGFDDLLADLTDQDAEVLMRFLVRAYKIGRTTAQVRSALATGVTVNV